MENSFLEAGRRGVGFFVAELRSGRPKFVLQFRAIAAGGVHCAVIEGDLLGRHAAPSPNGI